jgi:hypothetical protein
MRRLEETIQTATACQTGEKTSHDTTASAAASTSLITVGIIALRRWLAVGSLLRRIRALAGGKGSLLLLIVVAHLRRSLLVVALLLAALLLIWILLVATVGRLRGAWGRAVSRRFVLLEGHRVFW